MQTQAITVQLRLPGLAVWGVHETAEAIEVVAQYSATAATSHGCCNAVPNGSMLQRSRSSRASWSKMRS